MHGVLITVHACLLLQEFEEALIDDCGFERNIVIVHLLQKLLKAFVIRSIE